jgi:hypothetical protein
MGGHHCRAMIAVRAAKEGDDPAYALRETFLAYGYKQHAGSRFLVKYRELTEAEKGDTALPEIVAKWMVDEADHLISLDVRGLWDGHADREPSDGAIGES